METTINTNSELKINHQIIDGITIVRPTRKDIQNLMVGDTVLNVFGKLAKVSRIYAQKDDINDKAFVCYYTDFGNGAELSDSMKEGEPLMMLPVCSKYKQSCCVPKF